MATYRDKNTGVCISTDSELSGDWVPIEEFKTGIPFDSG